MRWLQFNMINFLVMRQDGYWVLMLIMGPDGKEIPFDGPVEFETQQEFEPYSRSIDPELIGDPAPEAWVSMMRMLKHDAVLGRNGMIDDKKMFTYERDADWNLIPLYCCHDCKHFIPDAVYPKLKARSKIGRCSLLQKRIDDASLIHSCQQFDER